MLRAKIILRLMGLLVILTTLATISTPIRAASPAHWDRNNCVRHKEINDWSLWQLMRSGFFTELVSDQAYLRFQRRWEHSYLSLGVTSNPNNGSYVASRITEVQSNQPIADRVKCWQATPHSKIVAEYKIRFTQAEPPQNLTENMIVWNASLPSPEFPETPQPITAIGVTRSNGSYSALIAEDFDFTKFTGLLRTQPMPSWLNPTRWHTVRVTLSQTTATVEVKQGWSPYVTVLSVELPHPAEPLGFEFSVDNQLTADGYAPVVVADRLDVSYLEIQTLPTR